MSAEDKTRITVDIYGTIYKLVGRSSVSYMKMVAKHVDDQMYHLSNALPQLESSKIAVLASVNIADEYFKLRKELEQLQGDGHKYAELEAKLQKSLQQNEEIEQLQQLILGHQTELQAAQQQHQAQQEYLHNVEQQLIQAQTDIVQQREELENRQQQLTSSELHEQQRLQEENAGLRNELEHERSRFTNQQSDDQVLAQEHEKLKAAHEKLTVEYEKLKKEYNEWIQLVMEKEKPS